MAEPKLAIAPPVDISAYLKQKQEEKVPEVQATVWKKNKELTEAIFELATAETLSCGENVEVIPLNSRLLGDDNASSHLVTRREQRAMVDYAFKVSRDNMSKRRVTVALRGSPGIGKSWSALLYIRKLMGSGEGQRPIIFEGGPSSGRKTHLIMPPGDNRDGKWVAYLLQLKELPDEWKECGLIDVVIDPAQFPRGEAPSPSQLVYARGHSFIPVSPDDRHLGGAHKTSSLLVELVLGPWRLEELMVAFPFMQFEDPRAIYTQHQKGYEEVINAMKDYYYVIGGLPRYLTTPKANARMDEITPAKAAVHSRALLDALSEGKDFSDSSTERILTRFFTLRAGEDQNGYNPDRRFATLDFVSPGAIKAAGKIILDKIHKDARWRGTDDASDIGLVFERVVLTFLAQGTEGMSKLGVKTRCKQLPSRPPKLGAHSTKAKSVRCLLKGHRGRIEEAPNNEAFEKEVRDSGKGMTFSDDELVSKKTLALPPDGYSNFDGMAGANMGFNATLQKNHSVSGPEYIRQRKAFGLSPGDKFAQVFVVTPDRFDNDWFFFQNFSWAGDEAVTNRKRRKVKAGASIQPAPQISQGDKQRARETMFQFVLTLEIEDKTTREEMISRDKTEDSEMEE